MKNNVIVVNIIVEAISIVIIVDMEVKWIVKVLKGSGEYMTENKYFEFKLCPNGHHYLYFGNDLYITLKGDYVILEQSGDVAELLDILYSENERYHERNLKLEKEKKELKELVSEVDNELEIRDIVCRAGKFRLEEWGKHRYHQFYKGDEELEDESVVIMLMELEKENKELKEENEHYKSIFLELVETALTDKNCRELYCKGILDIFDKANSLNQAIDMVKEHLK